jgi:protein TonB
MLRQSTFHGGSRRRGLIGFAILGLHAGVIILLVAAMQVPHGQPEQHSIIVDFLNESHSELDSPPKLSDPTLASVTLPQAETLDLSIPVEAEIHSEMTVAAPMSPPPSATAAGGDAIAPAALSDVAYLEPPTPRYPPESKHAREEGLVILKVLIDESGHASRINVYRSSGHPRLDEAACKAVQRAVFKPYVDGGVARAAVAIVPIEFSLHGDADKRRRNS